MTFLFGKHVHGNKILCVFPCLFDSSQFLGLRHILRQGCQILIFVELTDIQIALRGGHGCAFRNSGIHLVVDDTDRNGGIQCHVHGLGLCGGGQIAASLTCQRIGACNSLGLQVILQQGYHAQGAGGDDTVRTNHSSRLSGFAAVYIVECKASANTDTQAAFIHGRIAAGIRNIDRGYAAVNDLQSNDGVFFVTVLINFRHQEPVCIGFCSRRILVGTVAGTGLILGFILCLNFDLLGNITGSQIGQQNIVQILRSYRTAACRSRCLGRNGNNNLGTGCDRQIVSNIFQFRITGGLTLSIKHRNFLADGKGTAVDSISRCGCSGIAGITGIPGTTPRSSPTSLCRCTFHMELGILNLHEGNSNLNLCINGCCTLAGNGNFLIDCKLILAVFERHLNRSTCRIGSTGDGIDNLSDLVAHIGSNYQSIGGLIAISFNSCVINNTVGGCSNVQNTLIESLGRINLTGSTCCGIGSGRFIHRLAVGADCCSCDSILVLFALCTNHQCAVSNDGTIFTFCFCIGNLCNGLNIDHSNCQAAGNTDRGCARTGNRLSSDHMGGVFLCRNHLRISPGRECAKDSIRCSLAGGSQSVNQRSLNILRKVCGKECLQLRNVNEFTKQLACEGLQCNTCQGTHVLNQFLLIGRQTVDNTLNAGRTCCSSAVSTIGARLSGISCRIGRGDTGNVHRTGQMIHNTVQRCFGHGCETVQQISQQNILHNSHCRIFNLLTETISECLKLGFNIGRNQFLQTHLSQQGLGKLSD